MSSTSSPRTIAGSLRIFQFSQARTQCHLLEKMLSKQPDTLYNESHPFFMARMPQLVLLNSGPIEQTQPEFRVKLAESWQDTYERLLIFVNEANIKVLGYSLYSYRLHNINVRS